MEDLLEFLFGASGRINRAKYWRSLLIFGVAGMFVGVILLTAAGIAAPLFIVMIVIVFIPWLMWGIAIHTERLQRPRQERVVAREYSTGCQQCSAALAQAGLVCGIGWSSMMSVSHFRRAVMGKLCT